MKVNIITFSFLQLFNFIFCDTTLEEEYQPYLKTFQTSMHQIKLTSCLNLVETVIKQNNGFKDLNDLMEKTKFNKEKLYIKYIMRMLVNCVNKIKEDQIHYLITPENVDFYNLNNQSIINLIKINGNDINTIELNEEENKFYQEINQIYGESEIDKNIKEEKSFFEKYFYYIICIVLFIVLIFFNSFCKATKKNEDKENQNLNKDKQKKE